MTFGEHVRKLRRANGLTLRELASNVGVGFTYLSRVETGTMTYGDYPSEALIHRLADAFGADEDELLLLAEKVPQPVRKRVLQRPDAFLAFAACDDQTLDRLMKRIGETPKIRRRSRAR
jgi:HTH-type transcriptional regulator, competence development regulator